MSAPAAGGAAVEEILGDLANLQDEAALSHYLDSRPHLVRCEVADQLAETVRTHVRVDVREALGLAEAALEIARRAGGGAALGRSLRAKANALYMGGQNKEAVAHHRRALALFRELGDESEEGRTLSSCVQPLALLGEYDEALQAVEHARILFTRLNEPVRLARLEINFANILHRQDRFSEALACYERAYDQLWPDKDTEGIAVVLHNMAVCLIGLNEFQRAHETYERAREFCSERGMPLLVVQSDYNIAYLHYLRGNYSRAIEGLCAAREASLSTGDDHHLALCYLDLSEIYVELNLDDEAAAAAQEAHERFGTLGMGYEAAKCLANLAIALSRMGQPAAALDLFQKARVKFVIEKNDVWPNLIDLYQALVLFHEGRLAESRQLCQSAGEYFQKSPLRSKAVLCRLLLSRLSLRTGEIEFSMAECASALTEIAALEAPAVLGYQAHFLMGQIQEQRNDLAGAFDSYHAAQREMENLRSSLRNEELKITFMTNKLEVYERLVSATLQQAGKDYAEKTFGYIESAKSRSLRDLIAVRSRWFPAGNARQSPAARRVRELREELNWYCHRIEAEQLGRETSGAGRIDHLQKQVRAKENELARVLRETPAPGTVAPEFDTSEATSLSAIRGALGERAALVEYYSVGDQILAAVLTNQGMEIVPLALVSKVEQTVSLLRLQLSKFRLGSAYTERFRIPLTEATLGHLRNLYEQVMAPLISRLDRPHLILVPHGALHYIPFQALFDGREYLIDRFTISYAPSASIYSHCHSRQANRDGGSLILGVVDPQLPCILQEVEAVQSVLPAPEVYLNAQATSDVLRERGGSSRFLHIATHGHFRHDNPMFSGVRLGDGDLDLYSLYELNLPVELVTVSGCATGLNVVAAGDELLGMARGLLYAGAQSLLLTLWDVNDQSTAEFMQAFYRRFHEGENKAQALQGAMGELRERDPHPYHWAPFSLIGKVFA
ncbi:MAG: CHAT domain-containing tetratricopeptide repeat protein [Bryobacteraceae bacterium]